MSKLVDTQLIFDEIWKLRRSQQMLDDTERADLVMHGMFLVEKAIEKLPSVQSEQELLKDGTLVVKTDFDMTKFDRVNVIQNGTHYGDLFYRDEE